MFCSSILCITAVLAVGECESLYPAVSSASLGRTQDAPLLFPQHLSRALGHTWYLIFLEERMSE